MSKTRQWWISIPGFHGKLGDILKDALDEVTELNPNKEKKLMDRLVSLLLKVLLLDTVVIDKDYSNSCGLCSIPVALEHIVCSILIDYDLYIKKLTIYGAMYPSIVEIIIEKSNELKFLAISQVNLTDDLMTIVAKCTKLEVLHLMHNYIWIAVSTTALCKGFFCGASEHLVSSRFSLKKHTPISFPNLRVLDMGPCINKFVITLYKWILYYYNVSSVCMDWKTNVLEEGRKYSVEKIILPLISREKLFKLVSLYLNAEFLSGAFSHIKSITNFMPELNNLCLDCNFRNSYRSKAHQIGQNLKQLVGTYQHRPISKLYINISEVGYTMSILQPLLQEFGLNLTSLSLTSEFQDQKLELSSLRKILLLCKNIQQLKLLFLTRYSIRYTGVDFSTLDLSCSNLRELWMHEVSPWNTEQGLSHATYTQNWIMLLNILLNSSPQLQIFSVTVCETMTELLSNLESKVKNFHLHVKDGCEWKLNKSSLLSLIKRFSCLENLYLEELEGDLFWEIKEYFQKSNLNIFWGNLAGWPRS